MTTKTSELLHSISGKPLTIGNYLWAIRQGEEMSQVDFANLLGVSRQYICDLEHGRRIISPKAAVRFAKKLGYSRKQFIKLALQDLLIRDGIDCQIEILE